MLNRIAVSTAIAAALGALALGAALAPRPTPVATAADSQPVPAVVGALPVVAPPAPPAPILPELDAEQPLLLADDAWGDQPPPADPIERRLVSLGRGDTLMQLLLRQEVSKDEAHQLVAALRPVYDPKRLKSGQEIAFLFDRAADRFVGIEFQPAVERGVSVSRDEGSFRASEVLKPLERRLVAARATINSSLFQAGADAGVPIGVLSNLIRNYSYDVDFQRDIQEGDGFEILYAQMVTEDGAVARDGEIVYAALTLSGKTRAIFRFEGDEGTVEYFNARGESVRKALLRTPVDGARVSSSFGMRRHPVLGYSKMHKGVDFAAPTGTPIYAAGDGVVEEIGSKGAYGNYVRIRHNREIATAYAHMSRFGGGIRRGVRVTQGDVIGFVGSTGRSTGPHLHFEVMKGGRQVNPMSVDLPTGRNLEGKELKAFQAQVAEITRRFEDTLAAQTLSLVAAPGGPSADSGIVPAACTAKTC